VNDYYIRALGGAVAWVAVWTAVFARVWVARPTEAAAPTSGRHRAPKPLVRAVLDEVTLEQLLPPWPDETPTFEPARTWQWCPNDFRYESGALYPDGWICGHCRELAPAEDAAATIGGTRP